MFLLRGLKKNWCARTFKFLLETAYSESVLSSFWDTLYLRVRAIRMAFSVAITKVRTVALMSSAGFEFDYANKALMQSTVGF